MDAVDGLLQGLSIALLPSSLLYTFLGVFIGTMISHLPGIGPTAGMALLIPVTFGMDPTTALMMLAGLYYGCMYGGAVTAILLNTPGDAAAVMTCLDGYPMAQKGRAGAALAIAATSSFVAGTLGVTALILVATPLANFALRFGPAEYFSLMLFALSMVSVVAGSSLAKAALSTFIGLAIATIGVDLQTGVIRFSMGFPFLEDRVNFVVVVVGLFALGSVARMIEEHFKGDITQLIRVSGRIMFTREDWNRAFPAMIRGWATGFMCGAAPGLGGTIATMIAYTVEKRVSRHPEEFGHGAVEGVAGPEAAANADTCGALVHLLALGIPGSGATAVLMGAFVMYGIQPGPLLFHDRPDVAWGLIASMYVGNMMLLVLNLPLVGILSRILYVPQGVLLVLILGIASAGVYSLDSNTFDLFLMLFFGCVGYLFRRLEVPTTPLLFALILGGGIEQDFRQAMTISNASPLIFVTSPISAFLLATSVGSIALSMVLKRPAQAPAAEPEPAAE